MQACERQPPAVARTDGGYAPERMRSYVAIWQTPVAKGQPRRVSLGVSGFCLRCLNGASLTASISLGSIPVIDGVPVANNGAPDLILFTKNFFFLVF